MYSLRYRILLKSPVVLATVLGDRNMVHTRKFIPGTVVLGVLAERFIKKQGSNFNSKFAHKDETFYNWFLAGRLKISNAYIFSKDEYGDYAHYPSPFSLEKEKYDERVYDFLFHESVDSTSGIDDFCFFGEGKIQTRQVKTSINFHHARDSEKGSSKEGMIFNYESISGDQIFEGNLFGNELDLKGLLSVCGNKWDASIGRSRSAEYGRVEFLIVDENVVEEKKQVAWLEVKNEDDEDDEDDYEEGKSKSAKYISMALLSNLILYNEYGYPTVEVHDLCNELNKYISNIAIHKSFVKSAEVENFVGVWQMKKTSETCFAAGSTFLLEVERNEANIKQLTELQQNGIGERTHEGFGRCVFGLQTKAEPFVEDENKREQEQEIDNLVKPQKDIPDIAREIIYKIVKEDIVGKIKLKAMEDQELFSPFPPNALLAKLEAIIKNCSNRIDFVEKISRLRKIATDHLEHCFSRERNLLELIAGFKVDKNSMENLKEHIDPKIYNKLHLLLKEQYILIKELEEKISRKLNTSEKLLLLRHVKFCENPIDLEDFFKDLKNEHLKLLYEEISIRPEEDEKLKAELFKTYFTTFFLTMRKKASAKKASAEKDGLNG
ncbi:MAG: hypothetical protein HY819_22425 [Acidobacteria bacterium]|nr:hypothetical protein [Acidobacteriota bacterium]